MRQYRRANTNSGVFGLFPPDFSFMFECRYVEDGLTQINNRQLVKLSELEALYLPSYIYPPISTSQPPFVFYMRFGCILWTRLAA